jgi:hypothetical protein
MTQQPGTDETIRFPEKVLEILDERRIFVHPGFARLHDTLCD